MSRNTIPLSRPWFPASASDYVRDVLARRRLGAAGEYGAWCESFLEETTGCARALLTNSGSSALDAACVLAGLKPGDEVILPSFTFPSAASAVLKCGATPVFVDIESEHLTIDCRRAEAAVSPRTRALILVDYAGMPCDFEHLCDIAERNNLSIIEDAAHAFDSRVDGKALGTFGTFGVYSFQQTKNVSCGEGGALLVNHPAFAERAERLRDKGTNRQDMERGLVPAYEWVEPGGGIGLSELCSAVLRAQFEEADAIKRGRRRLFDRYIERLASFEKSGGIKLIRPVEGTDHNAHLFAFLARNRDARDRILSYLNDRKIGAAFHFMPLHASIAGRLHGHCPDGCPVTEDVAGRIVRLPLFVELADRDLDEICKEVKAAVAVCG